MKSNCEGKLPKSYQINTSNILISFYKSKTSFYRHKTQGSTGAFTLLQWWKQFPIALDPRRCIHFSKQDDVDTHQLWIHLLPHASNFCSYMTSVTWQLLYYFFWLTFTIARFSLDLYSALHKDSEQLQKPWLSEDILLVTFQLFKILASAQVSSHYSLLKDNYQLSPTTLSGFLLMIIRKRYLLPHVTSYVTHRQKNKP